ncbi:MAG: SUMF1/EgtB/PvdO family nonheme iron enzyme, partial [Myxococcota bacterium]|nr:SUMF1/EgtB/PvdO family nonheme iron enzyme [Myxococcota bacterium]
PTEAEWEYAARGGENYKYAGSNSVGDVAWYSDNSALKTHKVCTKKENGYGLCDMNGNVWEWVWDSWQREYGSSITDPVYVDKSSPERVFRGGCWGNRAGFTQVSFRFKWGIACDRNRYLGFRFLRTN